MMKDIPGYEGEYAVTDCGRVWSYQLNKFLKVQLSCEGRYYCIAIGKHGQRKRYLIHRLVAKAFIPNPECKEQVDHIDGDPLNNNLHNLRWVTHAENQQNKKTTKGYCWDEKNQKWRAQIKINKKNIYLGTYDSEQEAKQEYLKAKKIYHPTSPIIN